MDGTEAGSIGPADDGLHLMPSIDAAMLARRYVRARLQELGRTELDDSMTLAASELVTNAAIHAGTPLVVRIDVETSGAILLTVRDTSPALPRQRLQAPNSTTGRGLQILEALGEMGVDPDRDLQGKTVWFRPSPATAEPAVPPLAASGDTAAQ